MGCQLAFDIAARLRVCLELGLQGLNLVLGQSRTRQVLGVFFIIHNRLRVEIDHIHVRVGVGIAVQWMHHGRLRHGWIKGHGLIDWDAGVAGERIWLLDIIHCDGGVEVSYRIGQGTGTGDKEGRLRRVREGD